MKNKEIESRRTVSKKKLVALILVAILFVGILYEYIGERFDKNNYPSVGRIVPVNGNNMHLFSKGSGESTVVFASGWKIPCPYADFYPLWSEISKYARIAVYDRPGYGWSDVTDVPRDIENIAQEIHELLEKSGEKPPYILVGHSIGSLEVIRFAQRYPNEVKGVVLIDGSNPDMYSDVNKMKSSTFLYIRVKLSNWAIYISNRIGLTRLLFKCGLYSSTSLSTARNNWVLAPPGLKDLDAMMFLRLFSNKNQVDEGNNKESNASKVASNRHLNIPLTIVTSQYLRSYNDAWNNQVGLKNWSDTSKHIVVDGAGHAVHWTHPNIVNREILEILDMDNSSQNIKEVSINPDIKLIKIDNSFYIHKTFFNFPGFGRYPSNGLIFIKNGKALLIDTPVTNSQTEMLYDYLKSSMQSTITQVVIGHSHGDCMGGISFLHEKSVDSICSEKTKQICISRKLPIPKKAFSDILEFEFEGEKIICRYFGSGHTVDNIVVYFPNSNILFGGCLIKSMASKDLGNIKESIIQDWDQTVMKIKEEYPEIKVVIPGHGEFGDINLLDHTIELVKQYKKK